jgi:hypothetical protein
LSDQRRFGGRNVLFILAEPLSGCYYSPVIVTLIFPCISHSPEMHFQLFILFLQSLIANSSAFLKQDALFLDPQPLAHQSLYHRRFATLEIQDEFYGHRNVSYFVTSAGLALIDGDVVYGPVEDLLTHSTNQSITEEVSTQSF